MRAVVQRTAGASVLINREIRRDVKAGLVVFLGVTQEDTQRDTDYLAQKIAMMRIFEDENGKMNRSVLDVSGEILVISNFTLYGDGKKGNRPSFTAAARPALAEPLYRRFIEDLRTAGVCRVEHGEFGADMEVTVVNDGPVTMILETEQMMAERKK